MNKTRTRGNVIVEEIRIGDIHYEYESGYCIKSEVITLPLKNDEGRWKWISKEIPSGNEINYLVDPEHLHYSAKLYDYEAYEIPLMDSDFRNAREYPEGYQV